MFRSCQAGVYQFRAGRVLNGATLVTPIKHVTYSHSKAGLTSVQTLLTPVQGSNLPPTTVRLACIQCVTYSDTKAGLTSIQCITYSDTTAGLTTFQHVTYSRTTVRLTSIQCVTYSRTKAGLTPL